MAKDPNEKFFDEVASAMAKNDTEALDILMGDVEEEKPEEKEEQEVTAKEEDNSEVETDTKADKEMSAEDKTEQELTPEETIAKLTKELEESRKAQHKQKSDAGRVPGLQRKLTELDKKLQLLAEKSADNTDGTDGASIDDAFDNEHFRLIDETDPVLAKALRSTLQKAIGANRKESYEAVREVTNTFREEGEQEHIWEQFNILKGEVPDAAEIFQSKEWTAFKDTLTPRQRSLAESDYAEDVLSIMPRFDKFAGRNVNTEEVTKVTEDRERKLRVKTPGSSAPNQIRRPDGDDPETLFNTLYAAAVKDMRRPGQR